jgi:hypothetical protein
MSEQKKKPFVGLNWATAKLLAGAVLVAALAGTSAWSFLRATAFLGIVAVGLGTLAGTPPVAGMGAAAFVTSVVAIIGLGMLHGALQSVGVFVQAGVLAGAVVVLLWPYSGHVLRWLWVAARCRLQRAQRSPPTTPRAPNLGKKQGP